MTPSTPKQPAEEMMYELQEFFHHPLYGDDSEEDEKTMMKILAPLSEKNEELILESASRKGKMIIAQKERNEAREACRKFERMMESLPPSTLQKLEFSHVRDRESGTTRCCHFCLMSPDLDHCDDCIFHKLNNGEALASTPDFKDV